MGPWMFAAFWALDNVMGNITSGLVFTLLFPENENGVGIGASTGVFGFEGALLGILILNIH